MSEVKLTIDDKEVSVESGATILEAARRARAFIPTLCHDPDLEPYGGCRLCIVQVEGMRGLPPSCTTVVSPGMKVITNSPLLDRTRKMVLRLLLADHPDDCLRCRANMDCSLQRLAVQLGVREHGLIDLTPNRTIDESHPLYVRDMNRCILCGRCIRACKEILGLGAIDFIHRGHGTEVGTFLGGAIKDSSCESCGECVFHCPTGALSYREVAPRIDKEERTICPFCGTGCGIVMGISQGKVIRARGDRKNPVNRGALCVKGRFGSFQFVHDSKRLTAPLIKKNGEFVESTWEEALSLVAEKFRYNKGESFAALSSAKVANEDNYLMQRFVREVQGSNNIDHCARL